MTIKLKPDQKKAVINESQPLYAIMREVLMRENGIDKNREHLWVASLAANETLLNLELVSIGSTRSTPIEASAIFSIALQKDSKGIIIIHNHPSGHTNPSKEDDEVTQRMMAIGKLVDCPLLDHLIISETEYYSYADTGRLKLFWGVTNPFDPRPEKEVERLKEEVILRNEVIEEQDKTIKRYKTRMQKLKANKSNPKNKTNNSKI